MSVSQNVQDLALRIATQSKLLLTLINGNVADLSALTTTNKANLVAAINEVAAAAASATGINDGTTATSTTWSSTKIAASIQTVKDQILGGAGPAYDTLKELQDLLTGDAQELADILTALGQRVRVDAAQSFTAGEQAQARANIGAAAADDLGSPNTNFVATFEAGLV